MKILSKPGYEIFEYTGYTLHATNCYYTIAYLGNTSISVWCNGLTDDWRPKVTYYNVDANYIFGLEKIIDHFIPSNDRS